MVFMEADEYENYLEQEGKLKRIVAKAPKAEYQDYDDLEQSNEQPFIEE